MKMKFGIVITILLVAGCREYSTIPSKDSPETNRVDSLQITFLGLINHDTLYANQIAFKVDTVFIYKTNNAGKCTIKHLREGRHSFQIQHPNFNPFDTVVSVTSSVSMTFQLIPLVADYLPLQIDNIWTYRIHTYYYDTDVSDFTDTYGTVLLTVISKKDSVYGTNYGFVELRQDTTIRSMNSQKIFDTTYFVSTGSFVLIDKPDHQLISTNFTGKISFDFFQQMGEFYRYHIPDSTGSLYFQRGRFDSGSGYYRLMKNIGEIGESFNSSNNFRFFSGKSLELISYKLDNKYFEVTNNSAP